MEAGILNKKKKKRNAYQEFMDFVDSVVKELLIFMMICVVLCVLLQVAGRYTCPLSSRCRGRKKLPVGCWFG